MYISTFFSSCSFVGQKPESFIPSGWNTRSLRKSSQRLPVTRSTTAAPMSMPTFEYCFFVPGSKRIGWEAATSATLLSGILRDHPPIEWKLGSSNGKPPVWFITMRTVSVFFAFSRVRTPFLLDFSIHRVPNSGMYFETGSSRLILPSSTRMAIVTPQKPFVCEHCMYTSSSVIGRFLPASAYPRHATSSTPLL